MNLQRVRHFHGCVAGDGRGLFRHQARGLDARPLYVLPPRRMPLIEAFVTPQTRLIDGVVRF